MTDSYVIHTNYIIYTYIYTYNIIESTYEIFFWIADVIFTSKILSSTVDNKLSLAVTILLLRSDDNCYHYINILNKLLAQHTC